MVTRTKQVERQLEVAEGGERCELLVAVAVREDGFSRAEVRRWFEAGDVSIERDGRRRRAKKGDRTAEGDRLHWSQPAVLIAAEAHAPLQVVFTSDAWVIVDKPPGQACAPVTAGETGTVAQALLGHYPEMAGVGYEPREPGLVHRLDNDTSGLLWAARSEQAFAQARAALTRGLVDKRYLLVCEGDLDEEGTIDAPVRTEGPTVRIDADGRPATTRFRVLHRIGRRCLVEASASPAVRHQVRIHFAHLGAPLLGDERYGGAPGSSRHALHASRIAWAGNDVVAGFDVDSELPADLSALLR